MNQQIALITLVIDNYDYAINFYTQKLNFELVEDIVLSENRRWVIVRPPGSLECSLLLVKGESEEQVRRIGNQTGGLVFLFLKTDCFHRDYESKKANGIKFISGPKKEENRTGVVFEDAYGNLWKLVEFKNGW